MKQTLDGRVLKLRHAGLELAATLAEPQGAAPQQGWPLVLAFHGLTLSADFFADLAPELQKRGVALLGLDFSGHGKSGGLLMNCNLADQAAEVTAWLKRVHAESGLDQKRLGILAFSMGAVPALLAVDSWRGPRPKAMALWAPLLNTVEWSQRRLKGFKRVHSGLVAFWQGRLVKASLFEQAQVLDPKPVAEHWPGPLWLGHAAKDQNQLPSESRSLYRRRRAVGLPVEAWFPEKSGHFFAVPAEREALRTKTADFFSRHLK